MANLDISRRDGVGLAAILSRKGVPAAAIRDVLGLPPPDQPRIEGHDELRLIGTGPGNWLALAPGPDHDWAAGLAEKLAGLASISDQSGSYTIFRIAGPDARELLQRGAYIDLDPTAFVSGSAATTVIAYIGVIIWQLDDAPTFEVAVFRSLAKSFDEWIAATARGLGHAISLEI